MSYRHLSIIERSKLEVLHRQGRSSRAIAKELGRHPSTICRELDRVTSSHPYQAEQAQNAYEERRKASVSPGNWSDALAASLEEKLEATWSPEQITERFRIEGRDVVSFKTIYAGSMQGAWFEAYYRFFGIRGKRQKRAVNSLLEGLFQIAQKKSVPVKHLGTGSWIPLYRVVGKVKAV